VKSIQKELFSSLKEADALSASSKAIKKVIKKTAKKKESRKRVLKEL